VSVLFSNKKDLITQAIFYAVIA